MTPAPQPPATPVLSLTESQALKTLRGFLLGVLPANTDVIRAQYNRVPEPLHSDFVVMTPLRQPRLGTNVTTYADTVVTGSINGNTLTVTEIIKDGPVAVGNLIIGGVLSGTIVTEFGTGTGGIGDYMVSKSQTVTSTTLYLGTRFDLVPTELDVQLDVYGPISADNSRVIEGLFRSEYAVDVFGASGFDVTPLYCTEPQQTPFINAEQQYQNRWMMEACMQINPTISTPQQFFDEIDITLDSVDVVFPPS